MNNVFKKGGVIMKEKKENENTVFPLLISRELWGRYKANLTKNQTIAENLTSLIEQYIKNKETASKPFGDLG